jgi:hypothetical protein
MRLFVRFPVLISVRILVRIFVLKLVRIFVRISVLNLALISALSFVRAQPSTQVSDNAAAWAVVRWVVSALAGHEVPIGPSDQLTR